MSDADMAADIRVKREDRQFIEDYRHFDPVQTMGRPVCHFNDDISTTSGRAKVSIAVL